MTRRQEQDHLFRLKAVRRQLEQLKLKALLVTHLPNVRYLSGFTGSSGVLAVTSRQAAFFTDGRYRTQAHGEVKHARVHIAASAMEAAIEWLQRLGPRTVGVEGAHLPCQQLKHLQRRLRTKSKVKVTTGLIESVRQTKDLYEIEKLRAAARLGSSLFAVALRAMRSGTPEVRVAAEMEYAARTKGAEGMSFETIVASGVRSALPHGAASMAKLPRRGFVVLDFGVILSGYCSDMTRTVHLGEPDAASQRLYGAVLEAQKAAIGAIRDGVEACEVDSAARSVLKAHRLEKYFTHSTGHGVGLEIHEPPRLARTSREVLREGMVITVEPGAYIPGKGGVRIEDMVLVTHEGCEVLTSGKKELIVI